MKKKILIILSIIVIVVLGYFIFNMIYNNIRISDIANQVNTIEVTGTEINYPKTLKGEEAKELIKILEKLKYNKEVTLETSNYNLKCDNGIVYYIKLDCKGIVKDGKQADISDKDLQKVEGIILNTIYRNPSFEELPEEIPLEEAVEKDYFVVDSKNNKIYNKNVLDRFIENTRPENLDRKEDKIRIVVYNIDGYPTVYDVEYKKLDTTYINEKGEEVNHSKYILTTDPTRNNLMPKEVTTNDDIPGEIYGMNLIEYPNINAVSISLSLYAEINTPEKDTYKDIEIARYLMNMEVINK